jgi:hypothetical protein
VRGGLRAWVSFHAKVRKLSSAWRHHTRGQTEIDFPATRILLLFFFSILLLLVRVHIEMDGAAHASSLFSGMELPPHTPTPSISMLSMKKKSRN